MKKEERDKVIAEFGVEEGKKIIAEQIQIEDHVKHNNITSHSIDASGSCNMGCC